MPPQPDDDEDQYVLIVGDSDANVQKVLIIKMY